MINPAIKDRNPYVPAFGTPPIAYIHRYNDETKIINDFCSQNAVPMSYMIIGARGTGKTVLMHEMANRFETFPEWVVIRMNPNMDMLDSLMKKLAGHKKVTPVIKSMQINLSFFKIGIEMSSNQIRDVEDAITEILRGLKKKEKRLLVIVDEATNTPSMRAFASAYQNLIGQKLPVYLLMTGLFENISNLKNEKNLTFLYRMPRIHLQPLDLTAISENYKEAFLLQDDEAERMAAFTKGYSYAFQLLGDLAWQNDGHYQKELDAYRSALNEMVYDKVWEEMTGLDRDTAYGIAVSKEGKVKEIREILGWDTNSFSPYRDRLLKRGILQTARYGYLEMALPYFKGYVLEHYNGRLKQYRGDLPEDL